MRLLSEGLILMPQLSAGGALESGKAEDGAEELGGPVFAGSPEEVGGGSSICGAASAGNVV